MTPPKHGYYSHTFTPEEIAFLDAVPLEQHLIQVKFAARILATDLFKQLGLSTRQHIQILKMIPRFIDP